MYKSLNNNKYKKIYCCEKLLDYRLYKIYYIILHFEDITDHIKNKEELTQYREIFKKVLKGINFDNNCNLLDNTENYILSSEKRLQKVRNNKSKFSDWLYEPIPGPFYPKKLGIGDIIKNINKKYVIGPRVVNHKLDRGHPTKGEHKIISKFIKEKILEVYP